MLYVGSYVQKAIILLIFIVNYAVGDDELLQTDNTIVTGPAKTGHVGTNYTPSLFTSYLSTGIVFLHSVTCIMMPIKCALRAETFNTIAWWYKTL